MATEWYYNGRSGDPIDDATLHDDRDCAEASGAASARPIHPDSVDVDTADLCGECVPLSSAANDDSDSTSDGETCDVVKGDGEVCGRDRPCRYHD